MFRVGGIDGDQGEGTLEPLADAAHGLEQIVVGRGQRAGEQVGDDLGVGLRRHLHTGGLQFVAQFGEVLDDAVVDDRDATVLAQVRVRVAIRRAAMRGPPRVADADRGVLEGVRAEQALQVGQLAGLLADVELPVGHHGDAGGVVAAVLQTTQARDHDLERLLLTDVPHDPAHVGQPTRGRRSG